MFRLLISDHDLAALAETTEFQELGPARDGAKAFCLKYGGLVIVTQDVARVEMAPVVEVLNAPLPDSVYRDGGLKSIAALELEAEGPKVDVVKRAVGEVRPRLLVLQRRPTPAEIVSHLMVVAEGRIVKNAFGALELEDMPLTAEERGPVLAALGK